MWAGDTQYSQWALNPSAYQNVSHEEVDWAALAQQWIQMKETCPQDQVPPAPPPPVIGDTTAHKKGANSEAGEAPMDMELKDDQDSSNASNSQDASSWNSWSNWQQWGWNWGGGMPPGAAAPPPPPPAVMPGKGAPVPPYQYQAGGQQYGPATGVYDYNHTPGSNHYNQMMPGGYWGGGAPNAVDGHPGAGPPPGMMGPAPFIRQNRPDWRRGGAANRTLDRTKLPPKSDDEEDTTTMIDAAKRRQLPAWIREGLEKMEREKQKKLDQERQIREREALQQRRLQEEEAEALSGLASIQPKKSKFESDSEEEVAEVGGQRQEGRSPSPSPSQLSSKRRSRFSNMDSPDASPPPPSEREPSPPAEQTRSQEEILQEQMLLVRRSLTEILLEVTTEQLEEVANQVLHKFRAKAPAMQLRKTQALASLTGRLGLGMYGDSEESEDSADESSSRRDNAVDSDQELKEQILKRKQEFVKIERDIEVRLAEEEEQERQRELRARPTVAQEDGSEDEREKGGETQVENQSDTKRPSAPHDSGDESDHRPRYSGEYEVSREGKDGATLDEEEDRRKVRSSKRESEDSQNSVSSNENAAASDDDGESESKSSSPSSSEGSRRSSHKSSHRPPKRRESVRRSGREETRSKEPEHRRSRRSRDEERDARERRDRDLRERRERERNERERRERERRRSRSRSRDTETRHSHRHSHGHSSHSRKNSRHRHSHSREHKSRHHREHSSSSSDGRRSRYSRYD